MYLDNSQLSVGVTVSSAQTEQVPVEGEVDPGVGETVEGHQPVQRLHVHHLSLNEASNYVVSGNSKNTE